MEVRLISLKRTVKDFRGLTVKRTMNAEKGWTAAGGKKPGPRNLLLVAGKRRLVDV